MDPWGFYSRLEVDVALTSPAKGVIRCPAAAHLLKITVRLYDFTPAVPGAYVVKARITAGAGGQLPAAAGALTFDRTVTTLFFITLTAAACLIPAQNDTWWHLRAGEEMWLRRFVMQGDEFSFTVTGAAWPNHEWLSEVFGSP